MTSLSNQRNHPGWKSATVLFYFFCQPTHWGHLVSTKNQTGSWGGLDIIHRNKAHTHGLASKRIAKQGPQVWFIFPFTSKEYPKNTCGVWFVLESTSQCFAKAWTQCLCFPLAQKTSSTPYWKKSTSKEHSLSFNPSSTSQRLFSFKCHTSPPTGGA